MPDSSTTAGPILDLIAGGGWARRQLRAGIRYVLRRQFSMELLRPGEGMGEAHGEAQARGEAERGSEFACLLDPY